MRLGFGLIALALLIVGSVYVGIQWDRADDERARADTLERIENADTSKGDAADDIDWVKRFLDGL
jgi:hypothetical protein